MIAALLLALQPPSASATLNVRQDDGSYRLVERFAVPESHVIHDGLIAFEGPGWESDRVGYRLYLDARNAIDIFGKKRPEPVLGRIGIGRDDYHAMADWGMDIFKAGATVGVGGLGTLRNGRAVQLGPSRITASVEESGPDRAAVRVVNDGWQGEAGPARLDTRYEIAAGSRVTRVTASATAPVIAGLTLHPGMTIIASGGAGEWRYVATYGRQSLAGDDLGIALFYPAAETGELVNDGGTLFVRFSDPARVRYAFAAAWSQEPGGPADETSFRLWLDETAGKLGQE